MSGYFEHLHQPQRALLSHLLRPEGAYPSSIFIEDHNSPTYARALVEDVGAAKTIRVSPLTSPGLPALSSSIQRQLGDKNPADSRIDAAKLVARLSSKTKTGKTVLVVESAERILDLWTAELLEILLKLDEHAQCAGRLCVVFISALPWSRFRTLSGKSTLSMPITISLPAPSNATLRRVFQSESNIGAFLDTALPSVAAETRDLEQQRTLLAALWHMYKLPANADPDVQSLLTQFKPHFNDAFASIGSMAESPRQWVERRSGGNARKRRRTTAAVEGSTLSDFLLIAAFCASYNAQQSDVRYFQQMEAEGGKARKRGKRSAAAEEDAAEKLDRTQLAGPKNFTIERLLAIYESLLIAEQPGNVPAKSATVLQQINTLVERGHIIQTSKGKSLDSVTYRVNASYEQVRMVALAHGLHLDERLADWS